MPPDANTSDHSSLPWLPQQQELLDAFGVERVADVHCHCLPGLDDGPTSLGEAVGLCQALAENGLTTVVATPHQLGSYDRLNSAAVVDRAIAEMKEELDAAGVPLELLPGGDVRVDERLLKLLDSGEVISTAGAGQHLLLELPHELYVDPLPMIEMLAERGLQTIMTHPERHRYLAGSVGRLQTWVDEGAVLQITAGSLIGDFGRTAYNEAWRLVESGLVSLIATDAHDARRRPPRMREAIGVLSDRVGGDFARHVCIDNPLKVIGGEAIPSPPAAAA
ncbi:MAG: CpsB/CapC family capsule biosynthesis tyrosine phosphatase [Planctomycetota bacterium]